MATYLEDYLDKVRGLPAAVQRNFELIRQLDEGVVGVVLEMRDAQKAYLTRVKGQRGKAKGLTEAEEVRLKEDEEALQAVKALQTEVLQKSAEKVSVADQAYELVDSYIRQLDADLRLYEETLRTQGLFQESEDNLPPAEHLATHTHTNTTTGEAMGGAGGAVDAPVKISSSVTKKSMEKRKRDRDRPLKNVTAIPSSMLTSVLMEEPPIDPNEPTFCHCKRVSFGEMVACDNEECPIEWFHFACIGIKEQPKGAWYCSDECKRVTEGKRMRGP